jgi:hypothetical protein
VYQVKKLLIAVKSCQRDLDRGDHNIIRNTWGADAKAAGIDVKFFVGKAFKQYASDEVHLQCDDDYNALPYKTREICRWATGKIVDTLFLCDTDTYVNIAKLQQIDYASYDYAGHFGGGPDSTSQTFKYRAVNRDHTITEHHERCYPWASGGIGYFLSRNAYNEVAFSQPTSWAEDLWVGQIIGAQAAEGRMKIFDTAHAPASWHFPQGAYGSQYDPKFDWMGKMHEKKGL